MMYADVLVRLDLLGGLKGVPAEELASGVSPFTGRQTRRLRATVRVVGDIQHEQLTAVLSPGPDGGAVISGEDGAKWEVTNRSFSYQSGGGTDVVYSHTLELQKREDLALDRVEFGGLALVPDRWSLDQSAGGGAVTLTVLVTLEAGQHEQFEGFYGLDGGRYFPVTWAGIADVPVSMRFGRCLWEAVDDGGARHLVTFVAEEGDGGNGPFSLLFEPWQARLKEQSASHRGALEALLGELEQAGVLGHDAIERIRDKASNLDMARVREFDRVHQGIEDFFP